MHRPNSPAALFTLSEQVFIDAWSQLRIPLFRTWLLGGGLIWGGPMAASAILQLWFSGAFTVSGAVCVTCVVLESGCLFGVAMWARDEIRYRYLLSIINNGGTH